MDKVCLICGIKKEITNHHVVPRRHLRRLKSVNKVLRKKVDPSKNVVYLCRTCHKEYEAKVKEDNPVHFPKGQMTISKWEKIEDAWHHHFHTFKSSRKPKTKTSKREDRVLMSYKRVRRSRNILNDIMNKNPKLIESQKKLLCDIRQQALELYDLADFMLEGK